MSSCEKNDNTIIDPVIKVPVITFASVSPLNFDTTVIHMLAYARVQSDDAIQSVAIKIVNPANVQVATGNLKDDGILPDTTAGDKNFTGYIDFTLGCRLAGQYSVEFFATTTSGVSSASYSVNFNVNHRYNPIISNIIISPRDVIVGDTVFIIFWGASSHPDGLCNIKQVYYDGTKPDGGSLDRRQLYDDGSCCLIDNPPVYSGDTSANDGHYTRLLRGAPLEVGYYKYRIQAVDYTDSVSNILSDSIYVHQ